MSNKFPDNKKIYLTMKSQDQNTKKSSIIVFFKREYF